MEVGIAELGTNSPSKKFIKIIADLAPTVNFKVKTADDLFNLLALAKQLSTMDHLVIIAQLSEDVSTNDAFFKALAELQVSTGKTMFKCFYLEDEEPEIEDLAYSFIEKVFGKKFEKKVKDIEEKEEKKMEEDSEGLEKEEGEFFTEPGEDMWET